jgi:uncharacterized protein
MPYVAFAGSELIASGDLPAITDALLAAPSAEPILVFDAVTSYPVEIDLRPSAFAPTARICSLRPAPPPAPNKVGRPKLGVVAREVTLLPRHWEWLNEQPGGASVALRKLVEAARKAQAPQDQLRAAQESAYRFLSAMAGNLPRFEDATRALFAHRPDEFTAAIAAWPAGIRRHAQTLAATAFSLKTEAA